MHIRLNMLIMFGLAPLTPVGPGSRVMCDATHGSHKDSGCDVRSETGYYWLKLGGRSTPAATPY